MSETALSTSAVDGDGVGETLPRAMSVGTIIFRADGRMLVVVAGDAREDDRDGR